MRSGRNRKEEEEEEEEEEKEKEEEEIGECSQIREKSARSK